MKVYFRNMNGKEILLGQSDDDKQAMKIIDDFCLERSFNAKKYMRFWVDPDNDKRTICDFGSWNEFFIIEH